MRLRVFLLAVVFLSAAPASQVLAGHVEKGCKPAPDYLGVPHLVQDAMCFPGRKVPAKIWVEGGEMYVKLYYPDSERWMGTLVFRVNPETKTLEKFLRYRDAETKEDVYGPADDGVPEAR